MKKGIKEEIIEKLLNEGYGNKSISYLEFLVLFQEYKGRVLESQFATILEIRYPDFVEMKDKGKRCIILKKAKNEFINKDLANKIIEELVSEGYGNTLISYAEFLELYEPYKTILSEVQFANIIGIGVSNLGNMRNKHTTAHILKSEKNKEQEEKEKIMQEVTSSLKNAGYVNRKIDYSEFLELYKPYQEELTELEFAKALGISRENFYLVKKKGRRAIILKTKKNSHIEKIEVIKNKNVPQSPKLQSYPEDKKEENKGKVEEKDIRKLSTVFSTPKFYTLGEIEKLSNEYKMSIHELLKSIFQNEDEITQLEEALIKNRKIFIGKKRLSENFLEEHGEKLFSYIQFQSKTIAKNYKTVKYEEDIAQETILEVIENRGDLEENFNSSEAVNYIMQYSLKRLKARHMKCLKGKPYSKRQEDEDKDKIGNNKVDEKNQLIELIKKCMWEGKTLSETISIVRNSTSMTKRETLTILKSELISEDETPVTLCKRCIEEGMDKDETIDFVTTMFGISQRYLLLSIKNKLKQRATTRNSQTYMQNTER